MVTRWRMWRVVCTWTVSNLQMVNVWRISRDSSNLLPLLLQWRFPKKIWHYRCLLLPIKIRTYKALVLCILLYAAETRTLHAEDVRILEHQALCGQTDLTWSTAWKIIEMSSWLSSQVTKFVTTTDVHLLICRDMLADELNGLRTRKLALKTCGL